jgi:hypothetical protein
MQRYIRDSHRPKVRADIQEVIGNVTVTNPTPPIVIGTNTDTAVEGDESGSLSGKIRGLNKTITTLNANIESLIDNYERPIFEVMKGILAELKTMSFYLHQGMNIKDNPESLIKDFYREVDKITQ